VYLPRVAFTVLVVEDDPDLVHVFSSALGRAGHDVLVAATGARALEVVQSYVVHVVVTDRGLPDVDGTQAIAQMRELGYRGAVLVTSGHAGPEHEAACRAAGADAVLGKPFRLAELVQRVVDLAGGRELVA